MCSNCLGNWLLLAAAACPASGLSAERLFGSGSALPGGAPGSTLAWAYQPTLAGDWVVAFGFSGEVGFGLYAYGAGQVHRVVDWETNLPGIPGTQVGRINIEGSESYAVGSDGTVAFFGELETTEVSYFQGIWGWRDGALFLVAGAGTPVPGEPGEEFLGVGNPAVDQGRICFAGMWGSTSDPSVTVSCLTPGEGLEEAFTGVGIYQFTNLLAARDGWLVGAGRTIGTTNRVVVRWRPGMTAPETLASMAGSGYERISTSGGSAVILSPALGGVVHVSPAGTRLVFGTEEPDPATGVPSGLSGAVAVDGDEVAFMTGGPLDSRLWIEGLDGVPDKVIAAGDPFAGSTVYRLWPYHQSFENGQLVVGVELANGDTAIWRIDTTTLGGPVAIPTVSLAGFALLVLLLGAGGVRVLAGRRQYAPPAE